MRATCCSSWPGSASVCVCKVCYRVFVGCVDPGIDVYWAGAEQWQESEWDEEDRAHKGLKNNLAPKSLMGDKKSYSLYYTTYDLYCS